MTRVHRWASLVFALGGLTPFVVGFRDLLYAPGVAPKAQSLLLLLLGAAALASAVTLYFEYVLGGFVASSAVTLSAMTFLIAQKTHGDSTDWQWLWWISLAAGVIGVIGYGIPVARSIKITRAGFTMVGSIITAVIATGIVQFWYSSYYSPLQVRPVLALQTHLKQNGSPQNGLIAVDVTITVKNASSARIQILGTLYTLRSISTALHEQPHFLEQIHGGLQNSFTSSSGYRFTHATESLIQAGPISEIGSYLDNGESSTIHFVAHIPAKAAPETLALVASFSVAQGERLQLRTPTLSDLQCVVGAKKKPKACPARTAGFASNITTWKMAQPTWFESMISKSRYVDTEVVESYPGYRTPYLFTAVGETPDVVETSSANMDRLNKAFVLLTDDAFDELELHFDS